MVNYIRILDCFGLMSGLRINDDKSTLVPINCDEESVAEIRSILNCLVVSLSIKYLGISLGANPNQVKTWQSIINRIRNWLSWWKMGMLSKVGRIVLIKSILNNLPTYYFGLFKMPRSVAKEIISILKRFFWGKKEGDRFHPLVK